MKHKQLIYILLSFILSCQTKSTEYPTSVAPPSFMQMPIPSDNPTTAAGIRLGKQLFEDPILSIDSSISCASCHVEALAFSDGKRVSIGVQNRRGKRNAPSLFNVGFLTHGLFWDGRATTLEEQSLHPITDSVEMANQWPKLLEKLAQSPHYTSLFGAAFDDGKINKTNIAKALAQFERTLITPLSRFDSMQLNLVTFTASEQRGWIIFSDQPNDQNLPKAECLHCHSDPLFTEGKFENNGLDYLPDLSLAKDKGLGAITNNLYDNAKFKVPSLRHVEFTAPYMHDGRFETLEKVIEHYNKGGEYAENRHPTIRQLNLSTQNKADLIAFLKTLD